MQDIISDYYYHAYDALNKRIKPTEECLKVSNEIREIYDKLMEGLNEEQKELLYRFENCMTLAECNATEAFFKAGFKYGMCLAVECLEVPL